MAYGETIEYNGVEYEVGQDTYVDDPRKDWGNVTLTAILGGYDYVDAPETGELTDFLLGLYKDGEIGFSHGALWLGFTDLDDEEEIKESLLGYSAEFWDSEASAENIAIYNLIMEFINGTGNDVEDYVDFTNKANGILGISPGNVVKSAVVNGYSQGDWLEVVVEGPSNYDLDSYVNEFRMWAFGDVWFVTDGETGDFLSGIYADSAEEAVRYYVENYA